MAAATDNAFYLSTDTLDSQADLFQIVKELSERYAYRTFLLDEAHFLPGAVGALKQIHDFLSVRVVFASSVALALQSSAHDLARRERLHTLDYFSFREYLSFRHGEVLERLTLDYLLSGKVDPAYLRTGRHFPDFLSGGLLPFALDEPDPLPLLAGTLEKIIERDIPTTLRLHLFALPQGNPGREDSGFPCRVWRAAAGLRDRRARQRPLAIQRHPSRPENHPDTRHRPLPGPPAPLSCRFLGLAACQTNRIPIDNLASLAIYAAMTWQLQEAKNRFSEVVDHALSDGPQTITRHGRPTVVIVAAEQYARETHREKLSTILRECPTKGWRVSRDKDTGRTLGFQ